MIWLIIGAAVGFFVGGALGTLVAPKPADQLLEALPERLRTARSVALEAAERAEEKTAERYDRPRRRRRWRRGRRRG